MANPSFDVVSKVDRQEVDNALNQASKELSQRFDFRGTGADVSWAGEEAITVSAETEERCNAAIEVFKEKLIKRGISLKAFDIGEPGLSGKAYKVTGTLVQGISKDKGKEILEGHPGRGPQGHPGPDAGRPAPGDGQEEGRPPGRHLAAQGARLRDRAAVHQLPLTPGPGRHARRWRPPARAWRAPTAPATAAEPSRP